MGKSNYKLLVADNTGGAYLSVARLLSPYFSKVYYHTFYQNPFPRISTASIGIGFPEIEVLNDVYQNKDLYDIVLFPDIYSNDLAQSFAGKMIFGGSKGEILEEDRELFYNSLEKANLPVGKCQMVKDPALKKTLKSKKGKFIKVSKFRGELESFEWINQNCSGRQLTDIDSRTGPLSENLTFVVQDPIPGIETGTDSYCLNGQVPSDIIFGVEIKNACYLATHSDNPPPPTIQVNNSFAPIMKAFGYKGFYSTEIRVDKNGTPYFNDPACRAGSPPVNGMISMISNWDQIIPGIAQGNWVDPIYKYKYFCEIILKSSYVNSGFMPVYYDPKYNQNVCLKSAFQIEGQTYITNQLYSGFDMQEFGSVCTYGNNADEIMTQAMDICASIEGYDITYEKNALIEAKEQISLLQQQFNIKF